MTYTVHTIIKSGHIIRKIKAKTPEMACKIAGGESFTTKSGKITSATLITLLNLKAIWQWRERQLQDSTANERYGGLEGN